MKQICVGVDTFTQVDDADYIPLFNLCSWHTITDGYVGGRINRKRILMHCLIANWMQLDYGKIDHEDRNTLNNQRYNLRVATHSQNAANSVARINNTLGIKGVSKKRNKYVAEIMCNKIPIKLGSYQLEIEAAYAYQVATKYIFKEFARTTEFDFESDLLPDLKKRLIEVDVIARINTRLNRKDV